MDDDALLDATEADRDRDEQRDEDRERLARPRRAGRGARDVPGQVRLPGFDAGP